MKSDKSSQIRWVKRTLLETGRVSRNFFWDNYVRRLGAIINTINEDKNWDVKGHWGKDDKGAKDYIYEVLRKPEIRKVEIINGRPTIVAEQKTLL